MQVHSPIRTSFNNNSRTNQILVGRCMGVSLGLFFIKFLHHCPSGLMNSCHSSHQCLEPDWPGLSFKQNEKGKRTDRLILPSAQAVYVLALG